MNVFDGIITGIKAVVEKGIVPDPRDCEGYIGIFPFR